MFSRPGGTEIKMCDFSLSRRIVGIVKMEYGQPEYVAPEIVNGEGASFASDLWAVGIITYLLLSGVSPFRGQVQQRAKQTDSLPSYDVKLVDFKRMWWLLNCCHALGMCKYQNH